MDSSNEDSEVIINLKLLKRARFYSIIIEPNGKKIFGYNINRIIFAIIFVINHTLVFYSNLGFFVNVDYKLSNSEFFLILISDLESYLTFFKMCLFFYHLDKIVDLMDVTRVDFLTGELCRKHNKILYGYRNTIKKVTDYYFIFVYVVGIQWIIFAILNKIFFFVDENSNRRIPNIINMPFPVNTHVYNQYYVLIFAIESTFPIFLLYCSLMIDIFVLSFALIITFQYEVLSLAFKDLGHENKRSTVNDNGRTDVSTDLISLLSDQRNLFLKLKSFNEVSRHIVLAHIALNSSGIIILTFTFIMVYSSPELFSIDYLVKIGTSDLYLCLQLYIYCLLFENLNNEKDSVNFGIYSSNWTDMDSKSKKLLLLAILMNNANRLQMKASPRRIVNLQQFSSVLTTCYNIVSVMVNTLRKKN